MPILDYVVAAVPPTAALLAFGVLMRQIHQLVADPTPEGHSCADHGHSGSVGAQPSTLAQDDSGLPEPAGLDAVAGQGDVARVAADVPESSHPSAKTEDQQARTASDELLAIARTTQPGRGGRASRRHVEAAIRGQGLSISKADAETLKNILQTELDEAASSQSAEPDTARAGSL
ncbi:MULTISPECIES: hypothetical protein [Streptomyces]|uniref:hypothetical protein n=1 Tax=Streptomyces TaxID=1883 RepID=UPI0002EAA6D1|nr:MULTISPECIES: hypothetical protein [Streptomyces]MYS90097.1 hypothetical protein [Streptomyces sp. SID5464]